MNVHLTQVMHVPGADGKILSLKVLDQKGFESHIIGGCIWIMKSGQVLTETSSEGDLYGVNLKSYLLKRAYSAQSKEIPLPQT